jgi:hypothetical protein
MAINFPETVTKVVILLSLTNQTSFSYYYNSAISSSFIGLYHANIYHSSSRTTVSCSKVFSILFDNTVRANFLLLYRKFNFLLEVRPSACANIFFVSDTFFVFVPDTFFVPDS